jgi:hypothetical protein
MMPPSISAPSAASVSRSTVRHHSLKGVGWARDAMTSPNQSPADRLSGGTRVVYTRLRSGRIPPDRRSAAIRRSRDFRKSSGMKTLFRVCHDRRSRLGRNRIISQAHGLGAVNSRCSRMGGVMIPYIRRRTVSSSGSALGLRAFRFSRQPASSAKQTPTKPLRLSSPG